MLRKQVEKLEKRQNRLIAATSTALANDVEHTNSASCDYCGKKQLQFEEYYEPIVIKDKTVGANYRPKKLCKFCKKESSWDKPQEEKNRRKKN
jgi:hypothetical protein|tara:strand:- start:679 stop:957 length:279 start_codon:yes stop_codon:yes gene_type:complete